MGNTEHLAEIQGDKTHLEGTSKAPNKGCVTKCVGSAFKNHHGSYRKNGYNEHKGNAAKSTRYAPIPRRIASNRPVPEQQIGAAKGVKRKPKLPVGNKGLWNFTGKNFKSANAPFPHMYHHLVPWEVMSETFTLKELKLFQKSGYNINEGINLIILPCSERTGRLIGMYSHPNDHPTYSSDLIAQLTKFRSAFTGDEDESTHLKQKEVKVTKATLDGWEVAEWFVISEAGKAARGAHVDTHLPSSIASAFENIGP